MRLTKQHLRDLYRPAGPKPVATGLAWVGGGSQLIAQQVDLSLPIRGIRLVFKGRVVIGTANMTTFNPEGFLNLISNITIQGVNARQQGNITLWSTDLATLFTLSHMFAYRGAAYFSVNSGGGETISLIPSTPFPATTYGSGNTGTYDFRIVVDLPFHPFEINGYGNQPFAVPGFLVRNEEWKDSLQIQLQYGNQLGNSTGSLGTAAATTTLTYSSYGSGAGTPTVDIYSLPVLSGLNLKDSTVPGVLSRVSTPITQPVQVAGINAVLANLQKQPTTRVYAKVGVSTNNPAFSALSDTNITALGLQLGGNRNVRNKVDIWTHKLQHIDVYDRDPIQGYLLLDFVDQGNYDSAFPGQDVGDGASFQLVGDTAGVANALLLVVQEQLLHAPAGELYEG